MPTKPDHACHRDNIIHSFEPPLDTVEASALLNCSSHTLRRSRSTGLLFGVRAPPYIKRGRNVFYEPITLENWNFQFPEYSNTAQRSLAQARKMAKQ